MGNTEGQNRGDPWKTKEERRDLIAKYLKLQANAREIGLDEDAVADIQLKIDKLNKQVEKEPPPGHLLESTRLFLERAKKRLAKAEEELTELQEAMATKQELIGELQSQVQEAEGRLEQVKADLAKDVENPTPDLAKVQELEEILRGLCNTDTTTTGSPTGKGHADGESQGPTERAHPAKEEGNNTPKGEGQGAGNGTIPEDPPKKSGPEQSTKRTNP